MGKKMGMLWAAGYLLLAGCRSYAGETASCADRVGAFSEWVQAMLRDEGRGLLQPVLLVDPQALCRLERHADAERIQAAPTIQVTRDRIEVEGQPVIPDSVREREVVAKFLEAIARNDSLLHPDRSGPGRLNLAVAANAPWRLVVEAVAGASRAGYSSISLIFVSSKPREAKPPPPSAIQGELARIGEGADPAWKAQELATLIAGVVAGCPSLQKAFTAIASADPADKARLILQGAVEGVRGCDCKVDIPALQNILWFTIGAGDPLVAVPLRAAAPSDKVPLEVNLPPETPWAEAVRKLIPILRDGGKKPTVLVSR